MARFPYPKGVQIPYSRGFASYKIVWVPPSLDVDAAAQNEDSRLVATSDLSRGNTGAVSPQGIQSNQQSPTDTQMLGAAKQPTSSSRGATHNMSTADTQQQQQLAQPQVIVIGDGVSN